MIIGIVNLAHILVLGEGTLSASSNNGAKPSHDAAFNGHTAVLLTLADFEFATLRAKDVDGRTPAHEAAAAGHIAVLELLHFLVPRTIRAAAKNGQTPTHEAALAGHQTTLHVLQLLLSAGAEPDAEIANSSPAQLLYPEPGQEVRQDMSAEPWDQGELVPWDDKGEAGLLLRLLV